MAQFTYNGRVEYTVNTSSVSSLSMYYRLLAANPLCSPTEHQAYANIARVSQYRSFVGHISLRRDYLDDLLSKAQVGTEQIYRQARSYFMGAD